MFYLYSQTGESDEKHSAQSWAIATFLRHWGLHKSSHSSSLERVPSFVTKDKRPSKILGKKSKVSSDVCFSHHFAKSDKYKDINAFFKQIKTKQGIYLIVSWHKISIIFVSTNI